MIRALLASTAGILAAGTAADKIAEARALVAETEGHYPGPYRMGGPTGAGWSITSGGSYVGAAMGKTTTGLFLAAPELRATVAALADLAEVQAQRIEKLEAALRLHKAWSDSEDAGPDYGEQNRDTHPDGERIWRQWWDGNLDLCARAQAATNAVLGDAQ